MQQKLLVVTLTGIGGELSKCLKVILMQDYYYYWPDLDADKLGIVHTQMEFKKNTLIL